MERYWSFHDRTAEFCQNWTHAAPNWDVSICSVNLQVWKSTWVTSYDYWWYMRKLRHTAWTFYRRLMAHAGTLLVALRAGSLQLQWLATPYSACWTGWKDRNTCRMAALNGLIGTWYSPQGRNESPSGNWVVRTDHNRNPPYFVLTGEIRAELSRFGRHKHEETAWYTRVWKTYHLSEKPLDR